MTAPAVAPEKASRTLVATELVVAMRALTFAERQPSGAGVRARQRQGAQPPVRLEALWNHDVDVDGALHHEDRMFERLDEGEMQRAVSDDLGSEKR